MAWDPTLETEWAGEMLVFRLGTGEIIRLQDKAAPEGPWVAFDQLHSGRCRLDLIHEVIKQGLIGANKTAVEAAAFLKSSIETTLPDERRRLAVQILGTWISGAAELSKKDQAASSETGPAGSTPPPSTEAAPS